MSHLDKKLKKFVAGTLGVAMAVTFSFGAIVPGAQAATVDELQAQIASLLAQIQALQAQLSSQSTPSASCSFTRDLTIGAKGDDVTCLQNYLTGTGHFKFSGGATGYFGSVTRAAVAAWQAGNGVSPAAGYFGSISRGKYSTLVVVTPPPPGPGPTPGPTPAGTGLTVSKPEQPTAGLAPLSAARVPFTKITLTAGNDGDVTVNSIVVERRGQSVDAALAGVVLLDENGTQVGLAKTFNSNHQATLSEPVVVKKGESRTLTIAGNRPTTTTAAHAGMVMILAVVAVNTSATVTGTLPIEGAAHTINEGLTIGSVTNTRGPLDPNGAATKNVGTTGYTFSSVKITAGSQEDVRLNSVRWNQGSSSASSDLANLVTIVDGVSYPTTVSSDGKYYTSTFPGGITISKGNSKEVSIKGDIVGGSGRTVAFNLEKTTDVNLVGLTFGYGITPPTSGTGFDADTIWYAGSVVTINAGSLTVSNDVGVAAQNIAINLANQPLGGYTVDVKGESVSVARTVINAYIGSDTAAADLDDVTNVTLVDQNGTVLAGPVDGASVGGDTGGTFTFTDTITYPVGITKIKLLGKLGTDFTDGQTLQASTTPSADWTTVTGVTTGVTVTPTPSSDVAASTMTVKAAALTVSVASDPVAQTVVAGGSDHTFTKYLLNANASGEDIRITSMALDYSTDGTATNLTNCRLFDGATAITTGTNAVNPSAAASSTTFTFDTGLTIAKGTTKTLALKCNISSGTTGKFQWGVTASQSGTGLVSGQSVTATVNSSGGPRMTMSAGGALRVTLDSSSPSYRVVSSGSTGNTVTVLRFNADSEDIRIDKVGLQMTGATSSPGDIVKATLWDGSTQVGEAVFDSSIKDASGNYTATSTLTSSFTVPKDGYKLMTIKVDTAEQGVSKSGTPGNFIAIDWDTTNRASTLGVGLSSGSSTDPNTASDSASSGIRVFRSIPTIALIDLPNNGRLTGARPDLMRFKVTASPTGDIGIWRMTFRISTSSGITVNNLNVYAFEDSSYSTPVSGVQTDGALAYNNLSTTGLTDANTKSQDYEIGAATSGNASTTVVVPAGQTRYFVLRGDTSSLGSTYSVSSQLQGDAGYAANIPVTSFSATSTYMGTTTYINAHTDNDFIWRPFSTTTTQDNTANDYANGYGLPGLPTTNTTAQTGTN